MTRVSATNGPSHTLAKKLFEADRRLVSSLALTRLDKMLRQEANLGAWSIISPKEEKVCGRVEFYPTLREVMNESFREPTILVCDKVGGGEEIPAARLCLLTLSSVDVLSHSAVARNSDVLFATCHDLTVLDSLCAFVNEFASTKSIGSDSSVKIEHASEAEIAKATKMKLEDDPKVRKHGLLETHRPDHRHQHHQKLRLT